MGLIAELSLKGKAVLVVGGGRQALRKARQLKQEGARITAVASSFLDGFDEITGRMIAGSYEPSFLQGIFLVVAATDDRALNHRIVCDAKERNILSMSIHRDEDAILHSLGIREFGGVTAAVTTHGSYPALDQVLLDGFESSSQHALQKLPALTCLRERIVSSSLSSEEKRGMLGLLPALEAENLSALVRAMERGKVLLAVWHGTASRKSAEGQIFPFSREIESRHPHVPVCAVCLSGKMRDKLLTRGIHLPLLGEMLRLLSILEVRCVFLQPILFTAGRYYQQIIRCAQEYPKLCTSIGEPLVKDAEDAGKLFSALREQEAGQEQMLYTCHGFESGIQTVLRAPLCAGEELIFIGEPLPALSRESPVRVVPLLMLVGFHAGRDLFDGENSVCARLVREGYEVRPDCTGLMERKSVGHLFAEKIERVFVW